VCEGRNIVPFLNRRVQRLPYDFHLCEDCGFIFVHPLPDLLIYYSEAEMPDYGGGVWNTHYLKAIEKHTATKGKLLEIAFGNASFLKLAHDHGWEVHGVELNSSRIRHATEVLGLPNIASGPLEEVGYSRECFDVVAAFNFIEHVADPRGTLQSIWRILRPGGLVALMCPNISGLYHLLVQDIFPDSDPLNLTWCPPDHVGYFNKRNLKLLMERAGFAEVADESRRMGDLWLQHEAAIGPKVTDGKLRQVLWEIESSMLPKGEARTAAYRERIVKLLQEQVLWVIMSDVMELEPALGAEGGILFIGKKAESQR
jgi:SAM-dependent methyltransferase